VSFLGLGVQPPTASWGKELRVGFTYLETAPLFSIAPGVMISLAIISFNFVGDGLRDALDPRLRGASRIAPVTMAVAQDRTQPAALLSVRDLTVEFATEAGIVRAVDGVSFDLHAGEILALVGESGCGKSATALALLRLIADPPGRITAGSTRFRDIDLLQADDATVRDIRGNRIAIIFQEPMTSLNPVYTVGRQLGEQLELHRNLSGESLLSKCLALLESVSIPEPRRRIEDYPHQFSGGMRQRMMIAMGMSCDPDIVIADEPTTALDVTIQAQLLELLQQQVTNHRTALLLITHNLGVVARYADRVNVMYAGRIVESAPADDVYTAPRHPYTIGLLRSVPRLDRPAVEKLLPIEGQPPNPLNMPGGCAFHPRCPFAIDKCRVEAPLLAPDGDARQPGRRQDRSWPRRREGGPRGEACGRPAAHLASRLSRPLRRDQTNEKSPDQRSRAAARLPAQHRHCVLS